MAQVLLKHVSKTYPGGSQALTDICLEIRDREFVVLVGPSGCGKSTVLRIAAGLEEVTAGEVWIGSRRVDGVPPKDRDIAMVFQSYALYPHMTAYDNIAFALRIRRTPKQEIDERVRAVGRTLNIEKLLGKMPRALSGGERQRVALGRAIVRDPQVFLFDEPLSNLDAKLRSEMRTMISALHQRLQVTTIYVTHDQVEAMTMGERIVVLRDGVIQQEGDPLTLYNEPANRFVAGFIGSPPMNLLDATVADGEAGRLVVGQTSLALPESSRQALLAHGGRQVILGLRSEHVRLDASGPLLARVDLVEPTGGEAYVYATTDGLPVIARVEQATHPRIGERIRLGFDMTRAHYFDRRSEQRIA